VEIGVEHRADADQVWGVDASYECRKRRLRPPSPGYRPIFGVLWDMIGQRDLLIKKEPNSVAQAPEVVRRVWDTAKELGHDDMFVDQETAYPITDDHIPLLKAGLRVIDVIDIEYPYHHRSSDTIDKISAKSLSIVGDVAEALLR